MEKEGGRGKPRPAGRRVTLRSGRAEETRLSLAEINKMRVPGVPHLPAPPDPNMFNRDQYKAKRFVSS